MKIISRVFVAGFLVLGLCALSGCGSTPVTAKSAKNEIESATSAIETAKMLTVRGQFEQARLEYERAMEEIAKGEKFASGTDLTQLTNLKKEARLKKTEVETKAMRAVAAPKKTNESAVAKVEDPEVARKKLEQAKAAEVAAQNKDLLASPTKSTTKATVDEAEEVAAASKSPKAHDKAPGDAEVDPNAPPKPKKDKAGIFNDATNQSPPLEIVKLERVGRFNVAYCQLHNNTNNGKLITVAGFFKNRDNQIIVEPRTTVAFPYDNFSTKVKDLIADQSVRNIAPNREQVGGHEFLQFVCVGESVTEDAAKLVAKVYINVLFNDGSTADATSAEKPAVPDLVKGLVKKPK